MADSYRKIHLHVVFAVKRRQALLHKSWRQEVFGYIAGIINNRGNCSLAVGGYKDHIHLYFDYKEKGDISDLIREIKKASNQYINQHKLQSGKFQWQSGYGAFSCDYRSQSRIMNYIMKQEEHHDNKSSFKEEYFDLLKQNDIDYKEEYLFEFHE